MIRMIHCGTVVLPNEGSSWSTIYLQICTDVCKHLSLKVKDIRKPLVQDEQERREMNTDTLEERKNEYMAQTGENRNRSNHTKLKEMLAKTREESSIKH